MDCAALAAATHEAVQHLSGCWVCAVAQVTTARRAAELAVLEPPVDDSAPEVRDQFYTETFILCCVEGQQLLMAVGYAAMGAVVR